MLENLFLNVTDAERHNAVATIVEHASPRPDFFLMLVLSVATAVFGILLNSTVILIGSMLIAPLLYPILSLSLGVITTDFKLIGQAVVTLAKSTAIALATGFVVAFVFNGAAVTQTPQVASEPSLMYAVVAVIAGIAAAFAITKKRLYDTLPGVAVAVALVPPLAVVGVGLARFDWALVSNSLLLFLVNVIGIMFSALVVFSLMRFAKTLPVTERVLREEAREELAEHSLNTPK